jgi:hypothetical protein
MLYASPQILANLQAKDVLISVDQYNVVLATLAQDNGWNGTGRYFGRFIVMPGIKIGSTTAYPAVALKTGVFPAGSQISLLISAGAYVVGAGGNFAERSSGVVNSGGHAITAESAITIDNQGVIGGGGGVGGNSVYYGGGGGAGFLPGPGAAEQTSGSPGTLTTGGAGAGNAGRGGDLGKNGSPGDRGAYGLAGKAIIGNTNITWINQGDIRGAIT